MSGEVPGVSATGKWIYCIIGSGKEEAFPGEGVGKKGSEIYSVPAGDIAAVVGDSMSGSPLIMNNEELVEKLAAYQAVIEGVMKDHTVLPVKFGTTVRDNDEVVSILLQGDDQFRELLSNARGKVEVDVVAFWNKSVFEDVLKEEPDIRKARDEVAAKGKEVTLEDSVKVGRMMAEALARRKAEYAGRITGTLGECSLEMRRNRVVRDDMIVNAAFLVKEEDQELFDGKVMDLNNEFNDLVDFRCVGPLPPHSFSTIEISRCSFDEIDDARKKLGLDPGADLAATREAHLRLIPELHPDRRRYDPEAAKKFEEVTKAYQLLSRYFHQGGTSLGREDVESQVTVDVLEIDSL